MNERTALWLCVSGWLNMSRPKEGEREKGIRKRYGKQKETTDVVWRAEYSTRKGREADRIKEFTVLNKLNHGDLWHDKELGNRF